MNFLDALSYPIRRGGLFMILLGAVFSSILHLFESAPFIGLGAGAFAMGYFGAFYLDIVRTTMTGREELPEWPGFSNFIDDILTPSLELLGLVILSFGPLVAIAFFANHEAVWYLLAVFAALVYGCLYFPMAVLALHAFGSLGGALPNVVLPGVIRLLPGYLLAVVALILGFAVCALIEKCVEGVPLIGWFLTTCVALYSLMFQGRLIGLIYRDKSEQLGWE